MFCSFAFAASNFSLLLSFMIICTVVAVCHVHEHFRTFTMMAPKIPKIQCTPQTLQFLMELRGKEAVKFIEREFNGYSSLTKSLSSSFEKGMIFLLLTTLNRIFYSSKVCLTISL